MVLTIDTEAKEILHSGYDTEQVAHFARLHELDGYTIREIWKSKMVEWVRYTHKVDEKTDISVNIDEDRMNISISGEIPNNG